MPLWICSTQICTNPPTTVLRSTISTIPLRLLIGWSSQPRCSLLQQWCFKNSLWLFVKFVASSCEIFSYKYKLNVEKLRYILFLDCNYSEPNLLWILQPRLHHMVFLKVMMIVKRGGQVKYWPIGSFAQKGERGGDRGKSMQVGR